MKQLSKILSMFLILVMTASLFAGCVDSGEIKDITDTNNNDSPNTENDPPAQDITIEEQVLLDSNAIKITAKEYKKDVIWGDGIKLLVENNSDKDISVGCDAVIVNNFMITDLFYASVAAGKKSNETLYFSSSELEEAGITNIAQIEAYFYIVDSNTYDRIYESDVVVIKTSAFDQMDTTPGELGIELYNKNGIKIFGRYVDENSFWGASAMLYIENDSGKNVTVSANDVSINGFMVTSLFSSTVYDGKRALDTITFLSSDLEENDIESIETIELSFKIYESDTYSTIDETEPIGFNTK